MPGRQCLRKNRRWPEKRRHGCFCLQARCQGGEWFGQITHPETKEAYNTRFQQKDKDRWRLDGCTAAKVCLTGEFVRAK